MDEHEEFRHRIFTLEMDLARERLDHTNCREAAIALQEYITRMNRDIDDLLEQHDEMQKECDNLTFDNIELQAQCDWKDEEILELKATIKKLYFKMNKYGIR